MVFSATTMEFSQRATDSAVTVDNSHLLTENFVKCYMLSFHSFGGLATANGLRLSSSSSQTYVCK